VLTPSQNIRNMCVGGSKNIVNLYFIFLFIFQPRFQNFISNLVLFICKLNYFDVLCDISFKEHLPENGHKKSLKNVGDYAVHNKITLHICICACWSCLSQCTGNRSVSARLCVYCMTQIYIIDCWAHREIYS